MRVKHLEEGISGVPVKRIHVLAKRQRSGLPSAAILPLPSEAKRSGRSVASCILLIFLLITSRSAGAQEKDVVRIYFPSGEFVVAELALSGEQRAKGLMFRDDIAANRGMLFIFEDEAIHSFWMRNVKFPIDILWLDREKRIVHMAKQVPPCKRDPCPTYSPVRPSVYVLELRAGRSEQLGIRIGDRIEFRVPTN
jgi:uncharacterized membrane protein (UPF0127 family)